VKSENIINRQRETTSHIKQIKRSNFLIILEEEAMVLSRRFAQVSSDEEDDVPITRSKGRNSASPEESLGKRRKRKTVKLYEDFEEKEADRKKKRKGNKEDEDMAEGDDDQAEEETNPEAEEEEDEEEEEKPDDACPVGDSVNVTGKGKGKRTHFNQFAYDGNTYDLVSFVLSLGFLILVEFDEFWVLIAVIMLRLQGFLVVDLELRFGLRFFFTIESALLAAITLLWILKSRVLRIF